MNSKGISAPAIIIISTILILIVMVVVGVVIKKIISEETIEVPSEEINLNIENVYVDENNIIIVNVKRNPGAGELSGIKFIFYDGANSEFDEKNVILEELEQKNFTITLKRLNPSNLEMISIVSVYKSDSGEEITGSIADIYYF